MISIELNIPPYLHKYLSRLYGKYLYADFKTPFGVMILGILRKKTNKQINAPKNKDNLMPYTIKMSLSMFEKEGCHIFEQDQIIIAKTINIWFREQMYTNAVINNLAKGIPYKESIVNFLEVYGITEEELSIDAVLKDFGRKKADILDRMLVD
ncbi:hypothetical protein ACT4RS_05265 [Ornithobacterium rhinotracheale]|uniref:hypothetical protein n=1 Tax=Ornithobacterium rhinotracheale TaxID=28251 RepID=UPI0040375CD1